MPRDKLLNKAEAEQIFIPIFNLEATSSLPYGSPCAFMFDATTNGFSPGYARSNDGLGVKLPSSATGTLAHTGFAGIVRGNVMGSTANTVGSSRRALAQIFGICISTILVLSTRATSTDVWASQAAYALGDSLVVNTVAGLNGFSDNAAGAATAFLPFAVNAGFTQASVTTTGSSAYSATFSANTVMTTYGKVFLRAM